MKKADLITIRNQNWGDTAPASPSTPLRDPECDRAVYDSVIDGFFQAPVDNLLGNSGNTIVSPTASALSAYTLEFKKISGNDVRVKGYFTVGASNISGGTGVVFTLINSDYQAKTNTQSTLSCKQADAYSSSDLYFDGMNIKATNPFLATKTYYVDGVYTVNDL
jgi:hypothetical protein